MITRNHNLLLLIRNGNLTLATFLTLASLLAAAPAGWHFSTRNLGLGSIDLVWFFGALGLFFRWRIAWIASLVGTGATVGFLGSYLVREIGRSSFSSVKWFRQQHSLVISIFAVMIVVGLFLILFSASFGLFIGLLRMRKELVLT
jgi:hypothetical protein